MTDHAMQYGVGQLVINIVLFISALLACGDLGVIIVGMVALFAMIANIVLLGVGFGWFKTLTGYTIIEMYNQLGTDYWLSLPLLQRTMYFNMWLTFVVSCISAVVLSAGCSMWLHYTAKSQQGSR
jgi:hypothetical protein